MNSIISVKNLTKIYDNGFKALDNLSLEIEQGEIVALLGPNGAGKTTLISAICGLLSVPENKIIVSGFDVAKDYRKARSLIGLVPQEITIEPFEKVKNTVSFSRGLFGKPKNSHFIDQLLKDLSLFDKRDSKNMTLSGGMKRRVMIAKALSHEPKILFLDEPTAGVDVDLRKDMWQVVARLRKSGVTVILTTHYIEEAEEIADRIGIINKGELLLIENKTALMQRMGSKNLVIDLQQAANKIPESLSHYNLKLSDDGLQLYYQYDVRAQKTGIVDLLSELKKASFKLRDLQTSQSSLEEIFVNLIKE
ncbi:ABC transporter ATP-binding protein [Alphaproteobacteria bacterium]|nr:ABC transporter ATP-binding protein [Alphaproteobacteria bacterium]MDA9816116.1 ABC transporter ATP-binding protein [Alphaproteobacteria bacterium]MDC3311966.1 ABC transporter ATP-binding protein [Alphaproteobacteria bacterium]